MSSEKIKHSKRYFIKDISSEDIDQKTCIVVKHDKLNDDEHIKCDHNIEKYEVPGKLPVIPSLAEALALKNSSPARSVKDRDPDPEKQESIT